MTNLLKEKREAHNYTQAELARELGVTPSYYRKVEAGRARPSARLLDLLCATLNCHPGAIGYAVKWTRQVVCA